MVPAGHDNGDIKIWNMDSSTNTTLQAHTNTVSCMSTATLRTQDTLLLTAGYDGHVCLWEVRTMRGDKPHLLSKFHAHGTDPGSLPGGNGHHALQHTRAAAHGIDMASLHSEQLQGSKHTHASSSSKADGNQIGEQVRWAADMYRSDPLQQLMGGTRPDSGHSCNGLTQHCAQQHQSTIADKTACKPGSVNHPCSSAPGCHSGDPEVYCVLFDPLKRVILTAGSSTVIKVSSMC